LGGASVLLAPLTAPLLLVQLQPRLHILISQLEPIRSMGKLGAPVLVVAGSEDRHTTRAESAELYAAATRPKSFWILEGAKHEDFLRFDPNGYELRVVGFLTNWLMPSRSAWRTKLHRLVDADRAMQAPG